MDRYHANDNNGQYDISKTERMVMDTVRLHVPMHLEAMASWVLRCYMVEDRHAVADIEAAIRNCLDKSWLRVVIEEDTQHPTPEYSTYIRYFPTSTGLLDFTPLGNHVAVEVFGKDHVHKGT